ncbi:uncharacterized protein [Magallana gigas]|uniref:uncharacterized protein isoform X2 n=1 Tax=Magallana gigas TaxID=29159 RepID=UPI00148A3D4A|nr:uncharacterized protein LOC105319815 isoform X2 [Crassostrea gigas]
MAHQTIFEDPSEEFVDCTDEFLDKVIEECLAVPSDDHFSDAVIRRSQSDDFLSTSRSASKDDHRELQRPTLSEKNINELIRPPNKSLNDTMQSTFSNPSSGMTNGTGSSARSSSCNIDFLAEFERRVDLLEYTDYALEEVFVMLRSCVEKLCVNNGIVFENQTESLKTCETDGSACEESTTEITEHDKEAEVSANTEASVSADKEADVSDTEGTEKNHGGDKDKLMENETKLAEESDTQDNRGYLQDLLGLLVELEKRFEHFTAEIGDLVQLGALSAKHAARIEQYARCVQNTYLSMKADNEKMQDYLQIKETDWVQTQAQLHNEIVRQTEEIQALMTELSKSNMKNRIRNNMQDRHLNLVRKDSHSTEDIVTLMLHQRCSIEKAMALDFSRQSKINELKLLVLQQQSYIQKLELQNKEMDMVLQGLLFPADEPKEPPKEYENICPLSDPISMVSDVLCCDQALYVIDKSTDCSLVSEQIFQIGESSRPVSHSEGVFDPQRLSYVRREMREHEVPDTQSPIARDLGSGESGVVDSIAQEQECAVEDSKRKVQEPDEPSSFEEIKNSVKIQEAKITPLQI